MRKSLGEEGVTPPHWGGAPQWVDEAVVEEEVRGGEVQLRGKLSWWGQGLGLLTEAWPFCHFRVYPPPPTEEGTEGAW